MLCNLLHLHVSIELTTFFIYIVHQKKPLACGGYIDLETRDCPRDFTFL